MNPNARSGGADRCAAGRRLKIMLAMADEPRPTVLTPELWERLADVAEISPVRVRESFDGRPDLQAALADTEVLLTGWGCPPITAQVLDAAPQLRAVVHAAGTVKTFVDPIVFDRGIVVSSAAAANAVPVAEFTVAAIVLGGKRAFRYRDRYRSARIGRELPGSPTVGNHRTTVGIVGASTIGRLVAERLRTYDIDVLLADPFVSAVDAAAMNVRLCDVDTLFATADIVSLHVPLLPSTHRMVDARLLGLMRDGAVLVNTARGAIVDQQALEKECLSERIDAILDVTDPEPLPADSPLYDLDNVFLTPHIAGALGNEIERLGEVAVSEIERLCQGRPLAYPVRAEDLERIA